MRRSALALITLAALALVFALTQSPMRADAQGPPPGGGPGGPRPGGMGAPMVAMPIDSFKAERDSIIQVVLADLGDRKTAPAESVFKNLKILKGMPAERMLGTMNAFSRSLGVSCRYCHVPGHWKDEDKKTKELARQMMKMSSAINDDYLAKMDFGGDDKPHVGCMTCHRGEAEPMKAMRSAMRPPGPGAPPPGDRK